MIKFDETDLLMIFDEDISSNSESEIGFHSYKYTRVDNTAISVGFNKFEHTRPIWILVGIGNITSPAVRLNNCEAIRVLDTKKKQFEILISSSPSMRCFVDLNGDNIITIEHTD